MSKISARKREIVQQKEQQGEQLHHFYDDPLADVALISNDGMVLKHYSNLLRKNSGFFKDLFTLPACPAGSTSARSSADPPFQLPLDSSPGSIVTYLDILHARGASLPLIDVNAFEKQYNLAIFLDDRSLAERLLHHYHTNIEYDGFIALRLADRHPADEARLLAMGLKKIFHQPYGSPADAAAYAKYMADIRALPPRYLAEIAAKTFFRPLSTSSLCFVKYTDWHWVGDDAEVQDFIKAVRTARMAAEEEPTSKKRKL